jgi:hypothetical protein
MAFDSATRNRLAHFVADARGLIAEEFTQQFQSLYGISPKGDCTPLEKLPHLDEMQLATAALLRERIQYLIKSHPDDKGGAQAAVERLAREQAFTVLNRFAAIRMAEKRGIIVESIGKSYQSKGFKVYETVAGSGLGEAYHRYQRYLFCLFDELAVDLGVLFDRRSPHALLFPREQALLAMLELINDPEIEPLWAEDETIGWIYQYYNDPLERKKMREQSAAPRNSRELAVRNQFFTPRYVVEFLTDNTLGRIWYEMTKGQTRLKDQCRYLVRRPTEIFLNPGEDTPSTPENSESNTQNPKSQEELLRDPVHIPHRPLKDPRSILMLDPACGSMHFGLYAFDLFEVIYEEFWDLVERMKAEGKSRKEMEATYPEFSSFILHTSDFSSKEEFLRDIPRLIIENNLHGIDIDPRCAQIAGLSLWLRAQKAWQRLGLSPAQRPAIKRSNIVCAEPMPGEKELLREFVEREFPAVERAVCLRLLEAIFDKMQLAGEAGSLLKIEEEIRSAIEDARDAWQKLATKPPELFTTTELNQLSTAPELTGLEQAVSSLTTDPRHLTTDFWERIEERIYAALRDYAEQAENGGGFQRRLFAEDAARGFAFIDVCRKRYDVAVMNPPFGEAAPVSDSYLRANYHLGYIDLYTAFLDRGSNISAKAGLVGAITSRTAFTLSSFANWRRSRLLGETRVGVCGDLGFGVLDSAMVEVAAYTLEENKGGGDMLFIDLDRVSDKDGELLTAISGRSERLFAVAPSELLSLPNATMAYFLEPALRADFSTLPAISSFAEVLGGNATSDDERFIRCFWEVPPASLTQSARQAWRWISKGGEYSLFYLSIHLVVDWREDGGYLGEYMYNDRPRNGYLWGPKSWSAAYMGSPGVVWSLRTQKGVSFRALPAGCAMSGKSAIVTTREKNSDLALLGTGRLAGGSRISKKTG